LRLGYFDCFAGASGDMILACLFDVGLEPDILARGLGELGIDGLGFDVRDVTRKGIRAKSFGFRAGPTGAGVRGGKYGGTFKEIVALVEASTLAESVKARSIRAFDVLAEAEAGIHNVDKAGIHFHEVGSLDSVVDVVGSFLGMEALGLERVTSSPLALGTGVVECEHGTLPSPAPATVEIARGLPVRVQPY
jgi:uncharacterized protein (DUF111 family)